MQVRQFPRVGSAGVANAVFDQKLPIHPNVTYFHSPGPRPSFCAKKRDSIDLVAGNKKITFLTRKRRYSPRKEGR